MKLSELISSLHLFAEPPKPKRRPVDLAELAQIAARRARQRAEAERLGGEGLVKLAPIRIEVDDEVGPGYLDGEQIVSAMTELLVNALQANPSRYIELHVHVDPLDDRLLVSVTDDGVGMSEQTIRHACDPFFSEKPAGRQAGLGLARASRFVQMHAGRLNFESEPGERTCVQIVIPDWRWEHHREEAGRAA